MERPLRVLHLEDDPRDAELIADQLSTSGLNCTITQAASEPDFLDALDREPFDVVLCDYNLRDYDGISGVQAARAKQPTVPVLVISGTIGEEEAVRCLKAGATDYLLKDRLQRLGMAVERALLEAGAQRARSQAEAALRESELRFRRFVEQSGEVFWFVGFNPDTLHVSPAVEQIWGRPVEAFSENPALWLEAIPPHDRDRVAASAAAFVAGTTSRFFEEYQVVRPDGSVRRVVDTGTLIYDETGVVVGASGIARDVTEMKQLEEQFRQAQKMEAVGRLAGGVAHDFNNMLTVILGCTHLVMQELGEPHACHVDLLEVQKAAQSAARLTRQLLAFSRKQVLEPIDLDVSSAVNESLQLIRRLLGEDVEIVTRLDAEAGYVAADPGQLEQVLMNLAVNARDAMPGGGRLSMSTSAVELTAGQARELGVQPGPYVNLTVGDTGHGMTSDVQSRIFEPFFTTKGPGKGTGLGLATVYGIVRQSGGGIRVASSPGTGTSFVVYLPRIMPGTRLSGVKPVIPLDVTPTDRTILIVEDQAALLRLMAAILERAKYRVLKASLPSEAASIVARYQSPLDLLITDMIMPEQDGRALAAQLTRARPGLRVLYMSGYTDDTVSARAFESGAMFLQKPFTPEALTAAVKRALAVRDGGLPARASHLPTISP